MKKLLLVDGSSFLYRAFHAMPDLRNSNGDPTGAIYGVLNMLRRLRQDYDCDYSLCVFDAKGKTFRHDWYSDYKATRPPMPPDLAAQIEPLHQAIQAEGWQILAHPGVEADDVIGTLATQAAQDGLHVIVATGDKDMAQLVSPLVTLINTMTNEVLDMDSVKQKFGVAPEQIIDYLTLIGDKVDNVPGVEKVGPKTAIKWLEKYTDLDNLIRHADEIKGVVGNNLRSALEWLPQARRLITIQCDVELPCRYDQLNWLQPDTPRLHELYQHLEFKRWQQELDQDQATDSPEATTAYETILTTEQLNHWVTLLQQTEYAALDTETTSLNPHLADLVGLSFAVDAGQAAYLPLGHDCDLESHPQLNLDQALQQLRPWLESQQHIKIGQNLKYDMLVLSRYQISLQGQLHDTMLMSYILESHQPHNMDSLARRHLNRDTISYTDIAGKGSKQLTFNQIDIETATTYAAEDADITLQLYHCLSSQLDEQPALKTLYETIEMPVMQVLFAMEKTGVLLDTEQLKQQSQQLGEQLEQLRQKATELAGREFNMNSPKQIQEILFTELELPVLKKTPKGLPSTDESVLQELALDFPLPAVILENRSLAKLKSTYTDKLPQMLNPDSGRVHTTYSQAVTSTGRLASSDPNLQNIPIRTEQGRRIRQAFIARPGFIILAADYSQVELRIMACLSADTNLRQAFEQNLDIHRATASEIFMLPPEQVSQEQRRYAKAINFGLIYGMSAFGLAKQLGIERSAAQTYIDRYFDRYPGIARYMENTRRHAREHGWVETAFGRKMQLPEIHSNNGMRRQGAERAAINAPMQGTAADLIKVAMIRVYDWLQQQQMSSRLIMQVHDELVLEVAEPELGTVQQKLPLLMSRFNQLDIELPIETGYGRHWDDAH